MNRMLTHLCTLLILCSTTLCPKAIFWDLGFTLFEVDSLKIVSEISVGDFLTYKLWEGKGSDDLKDHLFHILNQCGLQEGDEETVVRDVLGRRAPRLFVEWQLGLVSCQEALEKAHDAAEQLYDEGYFSSNCEYRLAKQSLRCMFDPKVLARSMTPLKGSIKILKDCVQQTDENGELIHTCFAFSNWDPESFSALYGSRHGQKVLQHFDENNIIVSGFTHLIKPHDDIFEYAMHTYDLNPEECILIDDQAENRAAAERHGWTALHPDKNLEKNLIDLGVL